MLAEGDSSRGTFGVVCAGLFAEADSQGTVDVRSQMRTSSHIIVPLVAKLHLAISILLPLDTDTDSPLIHTIHESEPTTYAYRARYLGKKLRLQIGLGSQGPPWE